MQASSIKTHDCRILLQRILLVGLQGIMDKEIYETIVELEIVFREQAAKH